MEKEINRHLDTLESLEEKIDVDIDKLFLNLDVKEVFDNPEEALTEIISVLSEILDNEFYEKALKEGITFGEKIKGKDV